ncbi:MAG: MFS transporter [Gammaproteobacteria bacterium]|nr:MFS transporter [Gammaproteobacteria bacterium]NIR81956.1 MFS transporter [Gammaproteobacteria bacterium]NIR89008.1 MFS transporter [Gammaproteobacteria bacterium]NIU03063.1 MFS transporter [Gammaproteobacteria bacterium]NIV50587.1 MFS transporter [Gammaproteobacteria bacterium]
MARPQTRVAQEYLHVLRSPYVVLVAGAVVLALNMGVRQTFGLFLEPMTEALEVGRGSFSLAVAVQNLLWGMLTPFCGALADRWGTGRVLVAGGVLYAAGLVVMAVVQTPLGMHLGAGVLTGAAISASGFPLVLAGVARAAPERQRSTWLGIASAGGSIGQFALLPGTQLLIGGFGWSNALLALAAASALIAVLAAPLSGKPRAGIGVSTQSLGEALAEARRHRGYLLLTAGFFVCGFHVAFVATHLPAYIASSGLSSFVGATGLGLIGFFNIIGSFGAGYLGGRHRKKHLLAGIYVARGAAIALFMSVPMTETTVWLFSAVFGLLWLGTVPLTSGLVEQIFGHRYMATLFGIVMLSHQIGAFFGAWLGGLSYDLTGSYDAVWLLAVALALAAAALHWPIADAPIRRPVSAAEV